MPLGISAVAPTEERISFSNYRVPPRNNVVNLESATELSNGTLVLLL
jgi:hypothetical protein